MDTLSCRKSDKMPYKFVSKFCHLPQMNCVICGTGNMGVIIDWIAFVQKSIAANGIYQLDILTSRSLPGFMKEHNGDNLCTIYQFGLHEIDKFFHGFVYRSTDDFKSNELQQGLGVKPPDAFLDEHGALDLSDIPSDENNIDGIFIYVMDKQKKFDEKRPLKDRVRIGGLNQIIMLTREYALTKTIKAFDDLEEDLNFMLQQMS